VIGGFLKIGLASSMLSLVWSPYNILLILIFVAGGFLILFAIILAAACLAFWTTRVHSFLNIITNFSRFTEYPIEIYHPAIIFLLTFILPFAFVNYYPTQIFIGKGMHIEWAFYTPVVGIILFIIAYAIWKVGLKSYTSTGS
jgi:ABC-2 type transport system permease protein